MVRPRRQILSVSLFTLLSLAAASCNLIGREEATVAGTVSSTTTSVVIAPVTDGASFEWSMAPRFGLDVNGDGRPDIPNTFEYVHNLEPGSCAVGCEATTPVFTVELDASGSALDAGEIEEYRWEIEVEGDATSARLRTEEPATTADLPEGEYEVTLVVAGGGVEAAVTQQVVVEDILILSLGDSYAAGEGNPERPGDPPVWADDGTSNPGSKQSLDHDAAHRTGLAGPAQVALEIERADPHTSVTFVFLASSGATIEEGVTGPRVDIPIGSGEEIDLRPQVEEAAELIGCRSSGGCDREVDVVTLSIGGNDAGFSSTIGLLVALDGGLLTDNVQARLLEGIMTEADRGLATLPGLFGELDLALDVLDPEQVFITAYPAPTRTVGDGGTRLCEEIAGDLLFGLEVDAMEIEAAESRLLVGLNERVGQAAADHGWTYVDGHVAEFESHGYCGTAPYEPAAYAGNPFPDQPEPLDDPAVRWFRQAEESNVIQGALDDLFKPEQLSTSGTLHPNELGHQAYKRALLDAMGY